MYRGGHIIRSIKFTTAGGLNPNANGGLVGAGTFAAADDGATVEIPARNTSFGYLMPVLDYVFASVNITATADCKPAIVYGADGADISEVMCVTVRALGTGDGADTLSLDYPNGLPLSLNGSAPTASMYVGVVNLGATGNTASTGPIQADVSAPIGSFVIGYHYEDMAERRNPGGTN